jgi:hypothetical protein
VPRIDAVELAGLSFVLAGMLFAFIVPPLAVVAVWPLLFFIPGWVLVAKILPELTPPGHVGLAVVVSTFVSAHVVYLVAALWGFSRPTVFTAAVLLAAASWLIATRTRARSENPTLFDATQLTADPLTAVGAAYQRDRGAWNIAAASVLVVGGVLALSAWRLTPNGWVSGGWNWSDLMVHVSIAASIVHGNFPPEVPYFVGYPLLYHWFADFHGAIAAAAAGLDIIPTFVFASAVMAGALALLVWELAMRLTGDRRAAALAAILALFGGGMGYIRLPLDIAAGRGDLIGLVTTHSYDNAWFGEWPYFRIASVFGTGLLAHRATTFGLPGLVAVVLVLEMSLGRRPMGVAFAGILAALLAPFHFFAFPAAYVVAGLQALQHRIWRSPGWQREILLFLAPAVLAANFIVGPLLQQRSAGMTKLVFGWSEAPLSDGLAAVAFFYATNLGVPFLLAVVAAVRPRTPHRVALVGWMLALCVVPNLVVATAIPFDMNKFFQIAAIPAAILTGWLIRAWPRPLVATALVASLLSPALVGVWNVTQQSQIVMTAPQERAARWIERNTPDRSVFVTDSFLNNAVDLAGRLRITTFGPYVSNLGYDPTARTADVKALYCGGDATAADIMRKYRARYVVSSGGRLDCEPPTDFAKSARFETVYAEPGVGVFRLRDP